MSNIDIPTTSIKLLPSYTASTTTGRRKPTYIYEILHINRNRMGINTDGKSILITLRKFSVFLFCVRMQYEMSAYIVAKKNSGVPGAADPATDSRPSWGSNFYIDIGKVVESIANRNGRSRKPWLPRYRAAQWWPHLE